MTAARKPARARRAASPAATPDLPFSPAPEAQAPSPVAPARPAADVEPRSLVGRPQVDLFLESLVNAPMRDDRALMEFPFFSLSKGPRMDPIVYGDGRVSIEISPGKRGIATIWDKDVLIYVATLINARIDQGLPVERTVRIAAYDLLRATHRSTGKDHYDLLYDALFRLRSTTITTDILSGGERERRGFGWIDNFRIVERSTRGGRKVMAALEVTLNDWMYRAIVRDRRVLKIDSRYFDLTRGLERRLYELARKHCGRQSEWRISLPRLALKCGTSTDRLRDFLRELRTIVAANRLPEYELSLASDESAPPSQTPGEGGTAGRGGTGRSKAARAILIARPRDHETTDVIDEDVIAAADNPDGPCG
ncbi:Plasmid replication initiator (plasmid) [Rhodovastum atsumiense]|uniref:replication initiator protein A n=1 Tax=Rhodovastum atsumiense TaxID=504468 RepID=UPI0020257E7F|nr:replication initiator protein A [Rhodovastum atsumiense]CAH2605469.1 Plasmid replication initiator [Rhodovastum atsumiense]